MSEDIEPKTETQASGDQARRAARDYERANSLSVAEAASAGRVYFMRYAAGAPVYVIDRSGEVKPIRVQTPQGAYLSSIKADRRWLLTMFVRKVAPGKAQIAEIIFSVWDVESAEKVDEFYHPSPKLGSALACYKSGVFTFLSSADDGLLQAVRAVP